jgi:hypothetical protein
LQIAQNRLGKISPVLFLFVGAIWLAAMVSSGELVLVWPAAASILSGISLLLVAARQLRRPLGVASSLFGTIIALFQLYLSSALVGTALGSLAAYSLATFAALIVLQLILLYSAAKA